MEFMILQILCFHILDRETWQSVHWTRNSSIHTNLVQGFIKAREPVVTGIAVSSQVLSVRKILTRGGQKWKSGKRARHLVQL